MRTVGNGRNHGLSLSGNRLKHWQGCPLNLEQRVKVGIRIRRERSVQILIYPPQN